MNEEKPLDIFIPQIHLDMLPYRYSIALKEARERQERAEDFVERYPDRVHENRLDRLSQEPIALPPQRIAIPSRKRR